MQTDDNPHNWLKQYIRNVPDFPKPGIGFLDIVPLLANKLAFQYSIQKMAEAAWRLDAEVIVGIESRGFIFGSAVAFSLGVPFVPMRKSGKLPGKTSRVAYSLEYGEAELEFPIGLLAAGTKVVVCDDVLATGGTALAAHFLLTGLELKFSGYLFLLELGFLKGRDKLVQSGISSESCHSLLTY